MLSSLRQTHILYQSIEKSGINITQGTSGTNQAKESPNAKKTHTSDVREEYLADHQRVLIATSTFRKACHRAAAAARFTNTALHWEKKPSKMSQENALLLQCEPEKRATSAIAVGDIPHIHSVPFTASRTLKIILGADNIKINIKAVFN